MSQGRKIKDDQNEEVWTLKPQDSEVTIGWSTYENSKAGLKKLINDCVLPDYNTFYLVNRWYLEGEEAAKRNKIYHEQLSQVVWTDNPDVSFVPNYSGTDEFGSETHTKEFTCHIKKKHVNRRWGSSDYKIDPEVRREIKGALDRIDEVYGNGQGLVINRIEFVHTHYYSSNDRFVRIEVENVKDKKALKLLREETIAKEIAAAKAEAEAKKAAELKLQEEMQKADEILKSTEFGKNLNVGDGDWSLLNRWVREGRITEKFLNATSVEDLIPQEKQKESKDLMRIAGILTKAFDRVKCLRKYNGKTMSLIGRTDIWKARDLASQMNNKIKDEAKRKARKEAANSIGAGFLAECFN